MLLKMGVEKEDYKVLWLVTLPMKDEFSQLIQKAWEKIHGRCLDWS